MDRVILVFILGSYLHNLEYCKEVFSLIYGCSYVRVCYTSINN